MYLILSTYIIKLYITNLYEIWSLGRDLNPGLPPYQGGALTGLGHRGNHKIFKIIEL